MRVTAPAGKRRKEGTNHIQTYSHTTLGCSPCEASEANLVRMASYERAALVAPSTERMLPAVLCAEDRLSEAKIFDLTATDSDRQ